MFASNLSIKCKRSKPSFLRNVEKEVEHSLPLD